MTIQGHITKTRVVLADDHQMFRQALRAMLEKEPGIQVVAEAADGNELIKLAGKTPFDIVCMDIGMPHMNGTEATRRLLSMCPEAKVIGLSAFVDRDFILDLLKAGASGYVTKTEAGDELLRAIQAVRLNRKYLCSDVADAVTGALINNPDGRTSATRLGARERQVLQLVAEGCTSVQIAERLHIAPSTIEVHRRNIMRKLDLHSVAELTKYAIRNGLTTG
jgi:two-component system NarL family response regulator